MKKQGMWRRFALGLGIAVLLGAIPFTVQVHEPVNLAGQPILTSVAVEYQSTSGWANSISAGTGITIRAIAIDQFEYSYGAQGGVQFSITGGSAGDRLIESEWESSEANLYICPIDRRPRIISITAASTAGPVQTATATITVAPSVLTSVEVSYRFDDRWMPGIGWSNSIKAGTGIDIDLRAENQFGQNMHRNDVEFFMTGNSVDDQLEETEDDDWWRAPWAGIFISEHDRSPRTITITATSATGTESTATVEVVPSVLASVVVDNVMARDTGLANSIIVGAGEEAWIEITALNQFGQSPRMDWNNRVQFSILGGIAGDSVESWGGSRGELVLNPTITPRTITITATSVSDPAQTTTATVIVVDHTFPGNGDDNDDEQMTIQVSSDYRTIINRIGDTVSFAVTLTNMNPFERVCIENPDPNNPVSIAVDGLPAGIGISGFVAYIGNGIGEGELILTVTHPIGARYFDAVVSELSP